ncbi:uncharacterized protein LOC122065680 isoform X4 [Macadamia integrifolia]|uniref:uncharacterized protein LOC122065680 isoform X4 n=1 Tax=Macadamia integrifolia TaxID=60698 RepID=UPI001C4E9321|nr:uncharacterized protein LOC122065680 isoform X4 [Macadamia integrifolia]
MEVSPSGAVLIHSFPQTKTNQLSWLPLFFLPLMYRPLQIFDQFRDLLEPPEDRTRFSIAAMAQGAYFLVDCNGNQNGGISNSWNALNSAKALLDFVISNFRPIGIMLRSGEIRAVAEAWPAGMFGLDLHTRKMIGGGREKDGLYYLKCGTHASSAVGYCYCCWGCDSFLMALSFRTLVFV